MTMKKVMFILVIAVILIVVVVVQTSKKPEVKPAVTKAQLSAVTNQTVVKKRGNENPDGSVTLTINLKDVKFDGFGKK